VQHAHARQTIAARTRGITPHPRSLTDATKSLSVPASVRTFTLTSSTAGSTRSTRTP
jgi:hypothetical protein